MNDKSIRFGIGAVYLNIVGVIFSGLVFPVLTMLLHPQPPWGGPDLFIRSYHPLQTATFFCGYALVLGSVLTFIALAVIAQRNDQIFAISALCINLVFTAIIFLNYIIQTTYVPYLAANAPPEAQHVLATFTMSNPGSFAWALEMWGWGGVGFSYFLMIPAFGGDRLSGILKVLFAVNGACSVGAAIMTSIDMNWLFGPAGLASLVVWNVLVLVIDGFLIAYFRRQMPTT